MNKKGFAVAMVIGGATMLYGIWGLLVNARDTNPTEWAKWFIGSLVVHDFIVAPLVFLIGWILSRTLPAGIKAPIQAGFIASAIITAASWPLLRRYGANERNPSALPNDYTRGLLLVLSVVWIAVLLSEGWKLIAARRRRPESREPPT
jgi:hypothetical protein